MARQTLFAMLARQPWWMSVVIALGLFTAISLALPPIIGLAAMLPFLAVAAWAGWRQLREPGAAQIAATLDKLRAMTWEEFSVLICDAYRRGGYTVTMASGDAADIELRKQGYVTLVGCRRWKVAQTGISPLRELADARQARDAQHSIYVTTGDFTPNARKFAEANSVALVNGAALAALVQHATRTRPRWLGR